ncbi:MAG: DUF4384 domain-containing protein [Elusimicrobiota bacterium]
MNKRTCLVLSFFVFLSACAGPKPVKRNVFVSDDRGIMSKTEAVERELSAEISAKHGVGETASDPRPQSAGESVKVIKQTSGEFEFEASGEGISTKYERPIDAEKRAEEDALSKAVRESGVNVYSGFQGVMEETAKTSYSFIGKYISVWSNALVSYEKAAPAVCSLSGDIYKCLVRIRGKVYFKGDPDPNFELQAALGKPAYFEGDNVNLRVRLTKDAYITVLNCDEDGNVSLVFPNRHARNNFLAAGKDLNIPDDLPFQLKALLPQGRPETGEILHVIATKSQPLVLLDSLKEEKNGGFISYSLGGVKDLVTKLSRFSRADWTQQIIIYGVKSK